MTLKQTSSAAESTNSADTLVRPEEIEVLDPFTIPDDADADAGDHDRFSHYVKKPDIVLATTQGIAVFALCGKKWVARRSPEKYPVCPQCKKVYDSMPDPTGGE